MNFILKLLINGLAVFITGYILQGVHIDSFVTALIVAVVLGVINVFLKPILFILTLPVNIMTLGLFTFILNALLIMLTTTIVPGFTVDNFWWALLFSFVLSLINGFLQALV